jgi:hypothetical protein
MEWKIVEIRTVRVGEEEAAWEIEMLDVFGINLVNRNATSAPTGAAVCV